MAAYGAFLITQVLFLQDVPKDKGKCWPYAIMFIILSLTAGIVRIILAFTIPLCLTKEQNIESYGENFDKASCREIENIDRKYIALSVLLVFIIYIFLLSIRKYIQKTVKDNRGVYYYIAGLLDLKLE